MLRRLLAGSTLIAALSLGACQPAASVAPAPVPAAPTGIPLGGQAVPAQPPAQNQGQAQAPAASVPQTAPQAPAGQAPAGQAPAPGQPTAPAGFVQGAEVKRGEVPVPPAAPNHRAPKSSPPPSQHLLRRLDQPPRRKIN